MERALLWFKCAAMHDPVRPVIKKPAILGWEAKHRQVDLVIERSLQGDELLRRMKGWFTADVYKAVELILQHGKLKILDDCDLVIETKDTTAMEMISAKLAQAFGEEAWLEPIPKKRLA